MKTLKHVFALVLLVVTALIFPPAVLAQPGDVELKLGSRGDDVIFLQQKLQQAGCYPEGKLSGYFGLSTLVAVNKFEKENNLNTDGKITAEDWKVLAPELYVKQKSKKVVLGYYEQYGRLNSKESLNKNTDSIDFTAPFSHHVQPDGSLEGQVPVDGVEIALKNNVQPLLVVHNMVNNKIDSELVHQVLNSAAKRKKLVQNILQLIEKHNFAGVNIDFEAVKPGDSQKYNIFLKELKQALAPRGYLVTVAVPAKTSAAPGNSWSGAYNYKAIGQLVDYVVLMTYDEHWFGGVPGPVASLPWVERVVNYAAGQIPRDKILLGVAAYGYNWSSAADRASTVIWRSADRLARYGSIKWHDYYKSPYIKYLENDAAHEAWFENKYSLAFKLDLVNRHKLAGISIWRLGYEDDTFWQTVKKKFAS
ncbi:spore germination protein YaaH [Desulfohalotomaculum tongense]|uniref:glycosyl hydrolase family 18 protein n=1 Tax=Desulforadius tongensis TaxID=1216062 RepID=UPI00195A79FB|nr:glycosyl hydrolase family 18 protein [Desulforadius tongensis]MBM7855921.1 spore germination protein YaaH [Desulforadius tongensis]